MKRTGLFSNWIRQQFSLRQDRTPMRRARHIGWNSERLETRRLLVGNITTQFVGNDLFLSGSSDVDAAQLMVSGTSVVLRGLSGTTINGGAADFVVANGSTFTPGNVFASFGAGNDTFAVANGTHVRGGMGVDLGDGDDTFALQNASVGNTLSVIMGSGNDAISTLTVDIVREAGFAMGDGNDVISMKNTVVGQTLGVDTGAGNDSFVIEGPGGTQRVIGKAASIRMGDGDDNFVATTGMFCRDVLLDMGAGNDFVRAQGSVFRKNVTVLLGSGDDNMVTSGHNGFSLVTTVIGQGGTDNVEISGNTIVRSRNGVDIDGGSVSDTLETDRLTNPTTGAQTLATQLQQRVASLIALPVLTVNITPTTLAENAGTGAITGTVSIPAASSSALTVQLTGSDNTELTVPSSVTIPAGQTSVTFNINAIDDTFIDGNVTVTITATATGFTNGTDTISVTDSETGPAALTVTLNPGSVLEGAGTGASTATVTRNTDPAAALTVTLTSNDTGEATVPATVTIPAGQASVTFPITAVDDNTQDTSQSVVITASATGLNNGTATLTVRPNDFTLTLNTSNNSGLIESNGTLLTKATNLNVAGNTVSNATITVDSDNDGQFDDGTATAAANGTFTMNVGLTNNTTNRGANNLRFRAVAPNNGGESLSTLNVHRAIGSVTRFTSSMGTFDIELLDTDAPITVDNFKDYFSRYTNSIIHRSPDNFVIQGGGFVANNGNVTAVATDAAITNEFNAANSNVRGTLSMALSTGPNTGTSGWFINTVNNSFLDANKHTVFGRVIGGGMDIVDAINNLSIYNLNHKLSGSAFSEVPLRPTVPFESIAGTVSVSAGATTVTGTGTSFLSAFRGRSNVDARGSTIKIGTEEYEVVSITNDTQLTISRAATTAATNSNAQRVATPAQSNYVVFDSISEILGSATQLSVNIPETTLSEGATGKLTGTVSRSSASASPLVVTLTSSDTSELIVPPTVTIPENATSITFDIQAQNDTFVDGSAPVTVTASASGFTNGADGITVTDDEPGTPKLTVTLDPASVSEGKGANASKGTVTRNTDTTGPLTITLQSSDLSEATVPPTVTFLAGESTATFSIATLQDDLIDGTRPVTITAKATGLENGVATLSVTDDEPGTPSLTVTFTDSSIGEGKGTGATTGKVTRNSDPSEPLTVTIESSDTSEATSDVTVTIPANSQFVTFSINAVSDNFSDGSQPVTFTAKAAGHTSGTGNITVTDDEPAAALTVSLGSVTKLAENSTAKVTGTVTRNTDTKNAMTVTLESSDTSEATVPATITIPAGQTSFTFEISAVNDNADDGDVNVTITAKSSGLADGKTTLTVEDDEIELSLTTTNNTGLQQSVGTLLTKAANLTIDGKTLANAKVDLDLDGDGFDDQTATAGTDGKFTFTAPIVAGENKLLVRSTPVSGTGAAATGEIEVHRSVGTVARFNSSVGTGSFFDIELFDTAAPDTVDNFLDYLARYSNSIVHRSVDNSFIEGGSFTAPSGAAILADAPVANEFNNARLNLRGTLSTAFPAGQPNGATGGWIINTANNPAFDTTQHTVFGRVIGDGMNVVDQINDLPIYNLTKQLDGASFDQVPLKGTIEFENLTGTVALTGGSPIVIGTGTSFTTDLVARSGSVPGSKIRIEGVVYEVLSIQSNTQLTLTTNPTATLDAVTIQRQADPLQANYLVFSSIQQLLDAV